MWVGAIKAFQANLSCNPLPHSQMVVHLSKRMSSTPHSQRMAHTSAQPKLLQRSMCTQPTAPQQTQPNTQLSLKGPNQMLQAIPSWNRKFEDGLHELPTHHACSDVLPTQILRLVGVLGEATRSDTIIRQNAPQSMLNVEARRPYYVGLAIDLMRLLMASYGGV